MTPLSELITAEDCQNYGLKSGRREEGRNDAENGESLAAIRVRNRVAADGGRLPMIFFRNFRKIMGNPCVSKMAPLFRANRSRGLSKFWVKSGHREEGRNYSENGGILSRD